MQDLTASLILYGGLLAGYGSYILAYMILCRKAQRDPAGRSIIPVQSWKLTCTILCAGWFTGAFVWIVAIANLFVNLILSWEETCRSLIPRDQCNGAVWDWQTNCVAVTEFACAAIAIIFCMAYIEAKNKESSPSRFYPLQVLTCSHGLLVISWLLCTPLTYPLKLFGLAGSRHWTTLSSAFAFLAITTYIIGTALWIIALIRVLYAWRHSSRRRSSTETQGPEESDRDIALRDLSERYP